jgi:hypothetical protein
MKCFKKTSRLLLWVVLLTSVMVTSKSNAQAPVWLGFFYVTGLSEQCSQYGWSGTQTGYVIYRPSGIAANGPSSSLSFHWPGYALSLTRQNGQFTTSFSNVVSTTIGARSVTNTGTRVRITTHTPTRITTSTMSIRLVGRVQTLEGRSGCDGDFEATLLPRP